MSGLVFDGLGVLRPLGLRSVFESLAAGIERAGQRGLWVLVAVHFQLMGYCEVLDVVYGLGSVY